MPIESIIQPNVNKCHNDTHREKYVINHIFNHRDPPIEYDHEHYIRCVEMLKYAIKYRNETTLFCAFRDSSSNYLILLFMARQTIRNSSNIIILGGSIEKESSAGPEINYLFESENISLFKYQALSEWLDVRFSSPVYDIYFLLSFLEYWIMHNINQA